MHKKISEMTAADKAEFLEKTKQATIIEQGVPWEFLEAGLSIQTDLGENPRRKFPEEYPRRKFREKIPGGNTRRKAQDEEENNYVGCLRDGAAYNLRVFWQ